MTTLLDIEVKTRHYAKRHDALTYIVRELDNEIKRIQNRYMKEIAKRASATKEARAELAAALEQAKPLFARPRTQVFDGVKVGFQKGKGKIVCADETKTVQLIYKHLPEHAATLVRQIESPVMDALNQLPVAELKRIGCTVTEASDCVVIAPAKSDVDKLVKSMLKEGAEEE